MGRLSEYRTQLEAAFARFGAPLTAEFDKPVVFGRDVGLA